MTVLKVQQLGPGEKLSSCNINILPSARRRWATRQDSNILR